MITADPPEELPTPKDIRMLWEEAGLENPGLPGEAEEDGIEGDNEYRFSRLWKGLQALPKRWNLVGMGPYGVMGLEREVSGVKVQVFIEPHDWIPEDLMSEELLAGKELE